MEKELLSTAEIARILGITPVAVFKRIKSGKIKAEKVGRNYVIRRQDLPEILGTVLTPNQKKEIETGVKKVVKEYGETLRLLGKD